MQVKSGLVYTRQCDLIINDTECRDQLSITYTVDSLPCWLSGNIYIYFGQWSPLGVHFNDDSKKYIPLNLASSLELMFYKTRSEFDALHK